jgi:hypothetical protein
MENGGMESVAEIEQQLEGVTQMHVAAVNGDKALILVHYITQLAIALCEYWVGTCI